MFKKFKNKLNPLIITLNLKYLPNFFDFRLVEIKNNSFWTKYKTESITEPPDQTLEVKIAHYSPGHARVLALNVRKFGESAQNGLANVGESGESRKYVSTQVLAKVHMIRYAILGKEKIFYTYKKTSIHSPNLQDSPNSANSQNLRNTCQTSLCEYPIFVILTKLASHKYLFLTYSPNLTRTSHNISTKYAADESASTPPSSCNISKTCNRKI